MSEVNIEIACYELQDKCKCCLGDGQLRSMWEEHCEDDKKEIYGDMLNECFDLTHILQYNIETEKDTEQICESCICRLREALDFKREVLACAQLRFEHVNNGFQPVKEEIEDNDEEGEYLEDIGDISDNDPDSGCAEEQHFEDVEYLELDDVDNAEAKASTASYSLPKSEPTVQSKTSDPETATSTETEQPRRKWPRKKKQHEKLKAYKQYVRDDMLKAIAAVENGMLNPKEAAREFNVPRRTLATKLLNAQQGKDDSDNENQIKAKRKERHFQFIDEVKKILTYTNAIPFKTKAAHYFCTYCSTDGPCFEDADELRTHTRTEHVDDKMRNIEMILRPQYQNEIIKMDIDSLHCTVCCAIIPTWPDMFQHLEETHSIELDEAYTKVIPYILKRDLSCVLCNESFPNYHHLDGHMNSHYANYICSECGETFLSASRLTKHVRVHDTGKFPCEGCGKIFTLEKYRQKHFERVHQHELKIKCNYCPEKFYGTYQRHLHLLEKHKEKVRITTCELCGMRFEWRRYYVAHMRRKHKVRMWQLS